MKAKIQVPNDLYMSVELGKNNVFVIEECIAPKLSLKIRYNFLGHPVIHKKLAPLKQERSHCIRNWFRFISEKS